MCSFQWYMVFSEKTPISAPKLSGNSCNGNCETPCINSKYFDGVDGKGFTLYAAFYIVQENQRYLYIGRIAQIFTVRATIGERIYEVELPPSNVITMWTGRCHDFLKRLPPSQISSKPRVQISRDQTSGIAAFESSLNTPRVAEIRDPMTGMLAAYFGIRGD